MFSEVGGQMRGKKPGVVQAQEQAQEREPAQDERGEA
jgi:hypothetical protein